MSKFDSFVSNCVELWTRTARFLPRANSATKRGDMYGSDGLSVCLSVTLKASYAVQLYPVLELPGVRGFNPPPSHVYRLIFLSENLFQISIPWQNCKHFDI